MYLLYLNLVLFSCPVTESTMPQLVTVHKSSWLPKSISKSFGLLSLWLRAPTIHQPPPPPKIKKENMAAD